MEKYNLKGTYELRSLEEVVGEVRLPNEIISTEKHLLRNRALLATGLTLCTFVLGAIPAAAAVDLEKKLNFPYVLNAMYALGSVLIFVPKIDDPGLKVARYAGLLGAALGGVHFYYRFGGHN